MGMRVKWSNEEYLGIALMLFGACGFIQVLFVFISQYAFSVGNYLIIIFISSAASICLFFASLIIYESFAQVKRRLKMKSQFHKMKKEHPKLQRFLQFPISKPLLITFAVFSAGFLIAFIIANAFLDNILSFIIAENVGVIACFFVANFLETNYAKVNRI